jgi:hypothetical protein
MSDSSCDRWGELTDRAAVGDGLDAEEARFVDEHAASCAACGAEWRVWGALSRCLEPDSTAPSALQPDPAPRASPPVRLPWSRGRWPMAGVALVAAVAAAALWLGLRAPSAPPTVAGGPTEPVSLVLVSGEVDVRGARAAVGAALGPTDRVRIRRGRACLAHAPGISACAADGTELRLLETEGDHRQLALESGAVVCRLDAQPPGTRFSVQTPRGTVTAKGTVFAVEQLGNGAVDVRVHRGVVEVTTPAGESVDLRAPAAVRIDDAIHRHEAAGASWRRDAGLSELVRLWSDGVAAPLDVAASPAEATVVVDGIELGTTPLSTLVGRGEHELVATATGHLPLHERFAVLGAERVSLRLELPPAPVASASAVPSAATSVEPTSPSPVALIRRASALRSAGRYAEAAAVYRELVRAHPRSGEARIAQVSLGELELSQLGQAASALASFEAYLAGGGSLTQEARYGRIRALRALGRSGEATEAAAAFVRDYPGSAQARSLGGGESP